MARGMTIQGDKKLIRNLKTLDRRVRRKVIKQATSAAMTPVAKAAKQLVPKRTGGLKKAIRKRTKSNSRRGTITTSVGVWNFTRAIHIEYGTEHVPAQPFLRPAMFSNRARVLAIMQSKLKTGIEREAKKGK